MAGPHRPIVVLESYPVPRETTNPYITLLDEALVAQPGLRVLRFSWRTALLGRFDVFHVHWPDAWWGGKSRPAALVHRLMFAALLAKLTVLRIPVVRTLHNPEPSAELTVLPRLLWRWLESLQTMSIALNGTTRPRGAPLEVIPHGHNADWFARWPSPPPEPDRLAYFGLIRPYKGVPGLLRVFRSWDEPQARLEVAGAPASPADVAELTSLAAPDRRIELRLEYLPDADLVALVGRASLVVLPYLDMHNSGASLTALSLGRPILVPDNETNRALGLEVGPDWVRRYTGELTAQQLADAVRAGIPDRPPSLEDRSWQSAGAAHARVLRRAIRSGRN